MLQTAIFTSQWKVKKIVFNYPVFSKEKIKRMKVLCNRYLNLVQSSSYLNIGWKLLLGLWMQMIFWGILTFLDSLSVFLLKMMLHYVLGKKSKAPCILAEVLLVCRDNCHWNTALKNECASAKQNIKITILRFDGSLVLHHVAKTQVHYGFFVFFSSVACLKLWRSKTYSCILKDNGITFHNLTVI